MVLLLLQVGHITSSPDVQHSNKMSHIYLVRMLLLLVVCLGVAIGQEVTDEVIDNINEATGLALK